MRSACCHLLTSNEKALFLHGCSAYLCHVTPASFPAISWAFPYKPGLVCSPSAEKEMGFINCLKAVFWLGCFHFGAPFPMVLSVLYRQQCYTGQVHAKARDGISPWALGFVEPELEQQASAHGQNAEAAAICEHGGTLN